MIKSKREWLLFVTDIALSLIPDVVAFIVFLNVLVLVEGAHLECLKTALWVGLEVDVAHVTAEYGEVSTLAVQVVLKDVFWVLPNLPFAIVSVEKGNQSSELLLIILPVSGCVPDLFCVGTVHVVAERSTYFSDFLGSFHDGEFLQGLWIKDCDSSISNIVSSLAVWASNHEEVGCGHDLINLVTWIVDYSVLRWKLVEVDSQFGDIRNEFVEHKLLGSLRNNNAA